MICLTQSVARWRANSEHVQNRVEGSRAVHTRMRLRGGWREPGKKRLKAPPRQHPMNYGNTFSLDIYFFYIKGGWKKAVSIRWDREGWGGEIIKKNSSIAYSLFFLYMDLFKSSFHLFAFFGDVGRDFLFLFLFLFLFFFFFDSLALVVLWKKKSLLIRFVWWPRWGPVIPLLSSLISLVLLTIGNAAWPILRLR